MKLRDKDIVGPLLPVHNCLNNIPIESPWTPEALVVCTNYSVSTVAATLVHYGNGSFSLFPGAPAGLTQEESFTQDADMLCSYDHDDDDFDFDLPSHDLAAEKFSFYDEIHPCYKEMMAVMGKQGTKAEADELRKLLQAFTNRHVSQFASETYGASGPIGSRISSNAPTSTDRVTHGQRGKQRKRKQIV
jgi:hypothetical protein